MMIITATCRAAVNYISMFYCNYWVDTTAGGLFFIEDITRPVVSVSALTCFSKHLFLKFTVPK